MAWRNARSASDHFRWRSSAMPSLNCALTLVGWSMTAARRSASASELRPSLSDRSPRCSRTANSSMATTYEGPETRVKLRGGRAAPSEELDRVVDVDGVGPRLAARGIAGIDVLDRALPAGRGGKHGHAQEARQIGRASCRERAESSVIVVRVTGR